VARLLLFLKAPKCDDFLKHRACQLQSLVLRPVASSNEQPLLSADKVRYPNADGWRFVLTMNQLRAAGC
jgi:hypothetical protein